MVIHIDFNFLGLGLGPANIPNVDFLFRVIKTAFLYFLNGNQAKGHNFVADYIADLCASVQHTLIRIVFANLKTHTTNKSICSLMTYLVF